MMRIAWRKRLLIDMVVWANLKQTNKFIKSIYWLPHEWCVKAVKESYSALVYALNNIYEESHEPEALGLSKSLCRLSTIAAFHLLDFFLPLVQQNSSFAPETLSLEKSANSNEMVTLFPKHVV